MSVMSPGEHPRACIVVADDQASVLRPMEFLLRQSGAEVLAVSDGAKALELACQRRPDLAILDVHMPHLDGFSACRAIRESWGGEHHGHIWFMTACGGAADEAKAREAGADRFITKPFDPDQLLKMVRAVLSERQPRAAEKPGT